MNDDSNQERAVELLQQLGLKEYEAKCFVALSRRDQGTAKDISETSEVPRTRVYDAIRVLESKGLVETQHSNPQVFRGVAIDEAVDTLRAEYETRAESLRKTLRGLEPVDVDGETDVTHEVWALSGDSGITSRTQQLIDAAAEEIVLVIGHEGVVTDRLIEHLQAAHDRGVDVLIGTVTETLRERVREALPEIEVFVSRLEWLDRSELAGDETEISRLLLVDREAILVSSFTEGREADRQHEQAVFGRGFDNGLVAIVRRLMATGLLLADDPERSGPDPQ
jgi:sugar-specific transcriptional regulator TrmB